MITVIISDKGGQQSKLEFRKYEISIGRMKGNDIVLAKGNVSKRHASIYLRGESFFINDHGSTNGTYINGRKVEGENQVANDDKIYIGDFILQLEAGISERSSGPPGPPPINRNTGSNGFDGGGGRGNHDTLYDPLGGDADPLRQTFTSPPPAGAKGPLTGVPDGVRDTIGAHDELQPVGSGGRWDAAPYVPPTNTPTPTPAPAPAPTPTPTPTPNPIGGQKPNIGGRNSGGGAPPPPSNTGNARPDPPVARPQPDARGTGSNPPVSTGGGSMGGSVASNVPVQPPEVVAEFDADFFASQLDVARVLLDKAPANEMPHEYPPPDGEEEKYEALIDEAIDAVNPSVDRDELKELLMAECIELGPLERYLADSSVRDIYINHFDKILVRREGKLVQAQYVYSTPEFLQLTAKRLLGETADMISPGADEVRLGDGTRVHVVMPPLSTSGPLITVRKPPSKQPGLEDLVEDGVLSIGMADFLMRAIDAGRSIAVAGPTSSGKTTLIAALGSLIYEGMRIITIEDYNHIQLPQGSAVHLEARPTSGYDKRFLLRNALSMHPQRILLDECRGAEAYDWVTAVASGTEGSLLTVHGTSAADALGRLESLCLLGSHEISPRGLRDQIARAVNLVVVVNRINDEGFRVQQITEVQGVDLDSFRLNDIFYYRVEGAEGTFHPTGYIPLFFEDLRNAGVQVDFDIFQE